MREQILGLSYFSAEDENEVYARLSASHAYEIGDRVQHTDGRLGIIVGLPRGPLGYFWVKTKGGGSYSRRHPGANATWRIGSFTLVPAGV